MPKSTTEHPRHKKRRPLRTKQLQKSTSTVTLTRMTRYHNSSMKIVSSKGADRSILRGIQQEQLLWPNNLAIEEDELDNINMEILPSKCEATETPRIRECLYDSTTDMEPYQNLQNSPPSRQYKHGFPTRCNSSTTNKAAPTPLLLQTQRSCTSPKYTLQHSNQGHLQNQWHLGKQ